MLPEHIHPIPKDPQVTGAIAAYMGFDPNIVSAYFTQPSNRAWALPTAVVLLSEIFEGHKAELRVFPLTDSPPAEDDLRALLHHIFDLLSLRVIHAYLPVETADFAMPVAKRLGFQHDGALRGNRLVDGELGVDLIFSLTVDELETPPRLVH